VVVGVAGRDSDTQIPDFMDFVESALRMEDAIFRMTRERAVLFLADVDLDQAGRIVDRLISEFSARFPSAAQPGMRMGFFQVEPGCAELAVKEVLPAVFPAASGPSH
jgi:GGDEF domain-containing protein